MTTIIECEGITKSFDNVLALNDINLKLEENKIYGLLGPNGSGKTTLMKLISNQLFADDGNIRIYGQNPYENLSILQKICFVREYSFYPKEFKVKDFFDSARAFYPYLDEKLYRSLVKEFELDINKKYKSLSKGMVSMIGIIIGICSHAPITIFDEAYQGLDASVRQFFYDTLIENYGYRPRTFIFSTHLIDEGSSLFENVIILNKGRVFLDQTADWLKERSYFVAGRLDKLDKYLAGKRIIHTEGMGAIRSVAVFDEIKEEEQKNLAMEDIEIQPMPLQRLFVYLVGRNGGRENEKNEATI